VSRVYPYDYDPILSLNVAALKNILRDPRDVGHCHDQQVTTQSSSRVAWIIIIFKPRHPHTGNLIVLVRLPLPARSHLAPACSVLPKTAGLPSPPSNTVNMAKRPHQHSESCSAPSYAQQAQCAPPPRLSSLPSSVAAPPQPSPPVPLSQMTMEELMHILPKLDAAVIAHDWMPCMQKRQQELKDWLQKSSLTPNSESYPICMDKVRYINHNDGLANSCRYC